MINKQFLIKLLSSNATLSALILRVPVGIIFMAHGSQKLFGLFGGYGLGGTGQWMTSIGFEHGYLMAFLAGSGEFFGGLALVLGLLIRPAAVVTAFTMIVAILSVHISHGLFASNNGYEYALTLLVASLSLVAQGAGRFSLDHLLMKKLS